MANKQATSVSPAESLADTCIDVGLDQVHVREPVPDGALPQGLALATTKLWECGRVLDFHFVNGTDAQKKAFRDNASQWANYGNLMMRFDVPLADAEFRVQFGNQGNWSYVGTDNLSRPAGSTTMAIQNLDSILHEVGHALGCIHEHSSPSSAIEWNKPVVYQALGGSPNFWDHAMVDHNVFSKYAANQTQFSAFDPDSVMLYFFPASWTLNGVGTHANKSLSKTDMAFIKRCYPGCTVNFSKPTLATGGCTVALGPRTFFNQSYGNSWIMNQPNASFIEVKFNQPKQFSGNDIYKTATLKLRHLTSMAYPKAGNSPVDIIVNGHKIKENYSPPSGDYLNDDWDITAHMKDGDNVVRINFKSASTNYWIQSLQVDCERILD
jgi:hypothetical protein